MADSAGSLDIAVIGMAGRFPGAADVAQFWRNVCTGVESISFFSEEELIAAGIAPEAVRNPHYVKAAGVVEGADLFDAAFFGYYPREAEITDPQHRVFLECAWEALENAGYDPGRYRGLIGVWAGCGPNTYLLYNLMSNPRVIESVERYHLTIGNDKDFLPTRVSYKLNLRGPSVNVQTACSTSLVAVHLACQGLLNYQCDMALAGGVSIRPPQKAGYLYQEGGIVSPDGHCRVFDEKAAGTVGGNGAGILVLKRAGDAMESGDHIYALIKGSAINNDGSLKVGFTAPSVDGQAEVIAAAQALADIDPETIGYIEAHGTGTALGDPIEIAALAQAFRARTRARQFCAIGSVKTNVGHLDAAAGVAGAIKAVLALENKVLPPSLHFDRPNPRAGLADSPFFVNTSLAPWESRGVRRAGVSSFGMGGTNAHLVLEEAPAREPSGPARPWQLLPLSAKSPSALEAAGERLRGYLLSHPEANLADVAFTLQMGRQAFRHRRVVVARDVAETAKALETARGLTGISGDSRPSVAFLFTGQGAQHVWMAAEAYREEPVVREHLDRCAELLEPRLGLDLRAVLYPATDAAAQLDQTWLAQPALFTVEYALAQLWMKWGVEPQAMLGHSIGEYVAACLAGVFSLEDALSLVAHRGRLMQDLPGGSMLSVPLASSEVAEIAGPELSIAAENAPAMTVVSGPHEAVRKLEADLAGRGVPARILRTSHAFHSAMMDDILGAFAARVAATARAAPRIPFVSNVTGTWITESQATDPGYWARHLRETVRFAAGLEELLKEPSRALLEVGPGQTLMSLARQNPVARDRTVLASLPRAREARPEMASLLEAAGRLWLAGLDIDWEGVHAGERRLRVPLPTYPFERKRYWVDPGAPAVGSPAIRKRSGLDTWFYTPSWKCADLAVDGSARLSLRRETWLITGDGPYAGALATRLRECGQDVSVVPHESINSLRGIDRVIAGFRRNNEEYPAFGAAVRLARLLRGNTRLTFLTSGAQEVTGEEELSPQDAIMLGAAKVIPQEFPGTVCQAIDVPVTPTPAMLERLLTEFAQPSPAPGVAYRGNHRWVQSVEPINQTPSGSVLRQRGVYLITGGLGRIGLVLARRLAERAQARLVLVDRAAASEVQSSAVGEIEALGSKAAVVCADVADEPAMQAAVELAERRFGRLHGVFHLAGITEQGAVSAIRELQPQDWEAQFGPKVLGVKVLSRVLQGRQLDFCLLQSSLSSILGGLGFSAYSAANAFMDLFARQQNRNSAFPWLSVNWDGWRFGDEPAAASRALELSMSPEEGAAAFDRVLSLPGLSQIIVSTADLPARMERWLRPRAEETKAAGPGHERPAVSTDYTEPRTELECAVAAEWRSVLGIERIGIQDDFFELGGHSLLGTQLISRLRDRFHVELPLRRLFEEPTVAGLAALIESAGSAKPVPGAPGLARVSRQGELPLSFAQQRLWFLDRLEPGSPLYNNCAAVRLTGTLEPELLERSLNQIIRRHESLRTVFREVEGRAVQVILPELELSCPVLDLRARPEQEQSAALAEVIREEASRPFDLGEGPLVRFVLVRLAEADYAGVLTMHHIISDGWSAGILTSELVRIYAAFAASQPSPLPELDIQYADFAAWQREFISGEVLERQVAWWREQLAGCPPSLDLEPDRPRPALQSYRGATLYRTVPPEVVRRLHELCRAEEVTPFMALLAAFEVLLCRYTGQEDFAVGTPIAGRNYAQTEALIGCFVNTLVMRARMEGNPSFRELLSRVRETSLGAYANQDLPFEKLVEALEPERDLARTPLVQVMFVLQNAPMQPDDIPGIRMRRMEVDSGTAKFDLTLFAEEEDEYLRLAFNFNTDLFDAETIEAMAAHFENVLSAAVSEPAARVWDIPLLSSPERESLCGDSGMPQAMPPGVARLFEEQARNAPDRVALVFGAETLTYAELDRRASRVSQYLHDRGAGPESIVGLSFDRSPDMIVALWGILKSGAAFLPLDPSYPPERIAYMRQDAGVALVLDAGTMPAALATEAGEAFSHGSYPGSLAYVIYTSGSTGRPKGVLISHGALARHSVDVAQHFGLTAADRELQFASLNFDAGLEQVIAPLIAGATLYVREAQWSAREFHRKIVDNGLTVVNVPPAYWQRWVEELAGSPDLKRPESLRLVIVGGDVMTPELLRIWAQSPLSGVRLLNAYGPTETTITALTCDVPAAPVARIPIGRPLANRTAYVLDAKGNPALPRVAGELYLGGAGLARGYLNSPDLTAERFVPDPFSRVPGARLYRTGDRVRCCADGAIEFLGRMDQQVKIRGFRIELGEIEAALAGHPAAGECLATACADSSGDKRLVVYLAPRPASGTLSEAAVLDHLKRRLPDYMLPSHVVILDAMPMTPGGKIDRRALPAPKEELLETGMRYAPPRTPVERQLADLWAEVLNLERVGIHDNFFELRGHSLLAAQLVSRVRAGYGVDLPLRTVFLEPTVAGMAAAIAQCRAEQVEREDAARLEQLLAELDQMPDEEAQRLLSEGAQ